jgi:hypothetical protein
MSELALEYAEMIKDFLDERVQVGDFEKAYFAKFGNETRHMTEREYEILNWVFTDLDCFDPGDLIDYGPSIDEKELRASIGERYEALRRIISN